MSATVAQVQTAWTAAARILDQIRKFGYVNATNLLSLISTYEADYVGNFILPAESTIQGSRSSVAGMLSPSYIQSVLRPWLQQYNLTINSGASLVNDASMLQALYLYLAQNKLAVQSRNITYGTPAAYPTITNGVNAGNGQIVRLTRDQWNQPIENIWCDEKIATCVRDTSMGAALGAEIFNVQASTPYVDQIQRSGSGISANFSARNTADTSPGLFNGSFDFFTSPTGSATNPSAIQNWTSNVTVSSSSCFFDNVNYYRVAPNTTAALSYAIALTASQTLTQLFSAKSTQLNLSTPYLAAVIWRADTYGAQGTLTLQMGNSFKTVTVTGASGWNVTYCSSPTGQGCWPQNFIPSNPQNGAISLTFNQTGGSGLLIGEVMFLQAQVFDNTWSWMIPGNGNYAPWRIGDQLNWTDVDGGTGILQNMFWRGWNSYMPSRSGSSISWADPAP